MSGYPTDEELERLISQLEGQELYAPKHMKEQILSQAFPKQTAEEISVSGSRVRRVQSFTYRLKIIAGMAAAIIMLMFIPAVSSREPMGLAEMEQSVFEEDAGEDKSGQNGEINQRFQAWFDRVNSFKLETIFHMNDGGNYYEY